MLILPVIDLQAGQVVRGRAGRRQEYRPLVSRLTSSDQPLEVAQAFRDHFGLTELYLADLDAIAKAPPALAVYAALQAEGFRLRVDAGVRDLPSAERLAHRGIEKVVVGLETVDGRDALARICRAIDGQRLVFSLDLREGHPLGDTRAWRGTDARSIAAEAIAHGVRSLLVLDLAQVGMSKGIGTEELCSHLVEAYPELEIAAGGGIRDIADLQRLKQIGIRVALVASALHDGRVRREDLAAL
jgi:phosphoribosylformimino-5-aminoimidazole carboxamide ribotide isomerase